MQIRCALALVLAVLLAGCANEVPIGMPLASHALASPTVVTTHGNASATAALQGAPDAPRKTLASKVLAALALERVTGRKPDTAHFAN